MSKKLAKLLRTEFSASLPVIAKILESKGRNRDKILAHINQDEAELLRMHGGSGTINPETGLMEFYDGSYYGDSSPTFSAPTYYNPEYYAQTEGTYVPIETAFPTYSAASTPSSTSGGFGAEAASAPSLYDRYAPAPQETFGFSPTGVTGFRPSTFEAAQAITPPSLQQYAGDVTIPDASKTATAQPGVADRLAQSLGISKQDLFKLGIAGVSGIGGALQARQAAAQGQQARKDLTAMAQPYRQRGQQILGAAERGELTPVGQQQLQAMQARLAQGVEARGGVGAQQAQAQINAYRDQLIQAQYDLGLKVLNVADSIAAGAIKTGLAADQYVNELTNNYMTNVARTLYGVAPQVAPTPAA